MNLEQQLHRVSRGDRDVFSALYREWQPRLARFATGLLGGDSDAACDVADEALIAVWQQAGRFSGSGSAEGWLRRIVRNKAVDWLRARREVPLGSGDAADSLLAQTDTSASPEDAAIAASRSRLLRRALGELSVEHREAVWLAYFEELPLARIAEIAGCPENTVKTRLFHARRILRDSGMIEALGANA